jgi:hypothetical protein
MITFCGGGYDRPKGHSPRHSCEDPRASSAFHGNPNTKRKEFAKFEIALWDLKIFLSAVR